MARCDHFTLKRPAADLVQHPLRINGFNIALNPAGTYRFQHQPVTTGGPCEAREFTGPLIVILPRSITAEMLTIVGYRGLLAWLYSFNVPSE
jgi:hypothetical protein